MVNEKQLLAELVAARREIRTLTRAVDLLKNDFTEREETLLSVSHKLDQLLRLLEAEDS